MVKIIYYLPLNPIKLKKIQDIVYHDCLNSDNLDSFDYRLKNWHFLTFQNNDKIVFN